MTTILVVDDDLHILNLVEIQLKEAGFQVKKAGNGVEALEILEEQVVDLAVVDIMMPHMDGYTVTEKVKSDFDVPVILLTAKGEIEDKEKGFRSGSDDYVVKPFHPKELLFRIRAVLRRYGKPAETIIKIGGLTINRKSYEVQAGNRTILMPLKEFELLSLLASHPNQVLTRDFLIEQVWGIDFEGDERTINVHIKRIRERLSGLTDEITIGTVRGVGYRLEAART
ncbi:response regulator transcription factor [Halobacillus sp. MO56]